MSIPKKIDLRLLASLAQHFRPGQEGYIYPTKFCPEYKLSLTSYYRRLERLIDLGHITRIENNDCQNPVLKLSKSAYILLNENRGLISIFDLNYVNSFPCIPEAQRPIPKKTNDTSAIIRPVDQDSSLTNLSLQIHKSSEDSNKDTIEDTSVVKSNELFIDLYKSLRGMLFLTQMNLSQFKVACRARKGSRTLFEIKGELDILLWCLEKQRIGHIKDLPLFLHSVIVNGSKHVLNPTDEEKFFSHRYRALNVTVKEPVEKDKTPLSTLYNESDTPEGLRVWRIQHLRSLHDQCENDVAREEMKQTLKSACKAFNFSYSDLGLSP